MRKKMPEFVRNMIRKNIYFYFASNSLTLCNNNNNKCLEVCLPYLRFPISWPDKENIENIVDSESVVSIQWSEHMCAGQLVIWLFMGKTNSISSHE